MTYEDALAIVKGIARGQSCLFRVDWWAHRNNYDHNRPQFHICIFARNNSDIIFQNSSLDLDALIKDASRIVNFYWNPDDSPECREALDKIEAFIKSQHEPAPWEAAAEGAS